MDKIKFRELPGIARLEELANYPAMMKDEREEFDRLVESASLNLFGITLADTICPPDSDRSKPIDNTAWEANFEFLEWEWDEDKAFWDAIGLDMTDKDGETLESAFLFARQIVCVVRGIHPDASFQFVTGAKSDQQLQAEAEAWLRGLTKRG